MGYSDEQITMFSTFEGTEEEIVALAATLSVDGYKTSHYYDSSAKRTYFKVRYSWTWSSMPIQKYTDVMAFGWDQWTVNKSTSASYGKIKYKHVQNGTYRYTGAKSLIDTDLYAVKLNIPLKLVVSLNDYEFATSGYGYVTLSRANKYTGDALMFIQYAHNVVTISPSVSWNGASFSFSTGCTKLDSVRVVSYANF